jgi:hypothetical protein
MDVHGCVWTSGVGCASVSLPSTPPDRSRGLTLRPGRFNSRPLDPQSVLEGTARSVTCRRAFRHMRPRMPKSDGVAVISCRHRRSLVATARPAAELEEPSLALWHRPRRHRSRAHPPTPPRRRTSPGSSGRAGHRPVYVVGIVGVLAASLKSEAARVTPNGSAQMRGVAYQASVMSAPLPVRVTRSRSWWASVNRGGRRTPRLQRRPLAPGLDQRDHTYGSL